MSNSRYWFDPETNRYYKLDREHRELARQATVAKRARLSVERSAGSVTPLRENTAANYLASQLFPSSFNRKLHLVALGACLRQPKEPVDVVANQMPLLLRSFNDPLISLHPSLPICAYCSRLGARSITLLRNYETGSNVLLLTQLRPENPTDVLQVSPEVSGERNPAVMVAVDDKQHSTLVVERHQRGVGPFGETTDSAIRSSCAYGQECFFDAQWYPRGSQFVALGSNNGRAHLFNVEKGELSLICSPSVGRRTWAATAAKARSPITAVCWARGGGSDAAFSAFCGRRNGSVQRCDIRQPAHVNGTMSVVAELKSVVTSIQPLSFIDDSMIVAGSVDGRVALYDLRSTKPPAIPLMQFTRPVSDGMYHPPSFTLSCEDMLLTAFCADESVRCWTTNGSFKEIAVLLPPNARGTTTGKHASLKILCNQMISCCFNNGESFMWRIPPFV